MPVQTEDKRSHLVFRDTSASHAFTAHSPGGRSKSLPGRDRKAHGLALRRQLQELKPAAQAAAAWQRALALESGIGLVVEFVGLPDVELAFQSLADDRQKIELLSVRIEGNVTVANVFIPDGRLEHFERYVIDYLVEKKGKKGQTLDHKALLNGLVAYGDLTQGLGKTGSLRVGHRLESVKLTPHDGSNEGDSKHHAYLFAEAVSRAEITAVDRSRVFMSAVTASDYRDRGRPSSWSAMLDGLAADVDDPSQCPRLFILAAGNIRSHGAWVTYPDSLATNLIHDPGQAWNAITVGACTHKIDTENETVRAVALEGGLSPYTTTSVTWDGAWPLKPEVVFEGGNVSIDSLGAVGLPSLNLLTTNHKPFERLFTTTNATSAASALCARMAAQIMTEYPKLRPETIRALIVHSAQWTSAMRSMYLPASGKQSKKDYVNLIRHCGWGEPDVDRALWSAGNSLTLVLEDQVQPYGKDANNRVVSRDMNLHALPWPKQELEQLGDTTVQLHVTLSYFIEPNPSARGTSSKFYYPSHRLRFDVQRPLDASTEDFIARVNAAAQREDEGSAANPKDTQWYLGDRQRHRGSLHRDVWEGTAADLASRGFIAVYPAAGWWRSRPALQRYGLTARYSLVVSIRTEQTEIDLYNAIANKISIKV